MLQCQLCVLRYTVLCVTMSVVCVKENYFVCYSVSCVYYTIKVYCFVCYSVSCVLRCTILCVRVSVVCVKVYYCVCMQSGWEDIIFFLFFVFFLPNFCLTVCFFLWPLQNL